MKPTAATVTSALEDKLQQLAEAGVLAWSGCKLSARTPSIRPRDGRTIADLLVEDRDWRQPETKE